MNYRLEKMRVKKMSNWMDNHPTLVSWASVLIFIVGIMLIGLAIFSPSQLLYPTIQLQDQQVEDSYSEDP